MPPAKAAWLACNAMTTQEMIAYCLAKPGAYLDQPFGDEPICARVEKRIFAEIYQLRGWLTLKCEPVYGMALRQQYPDTIRRGYHCPPLQQPYSNTITLDGTVPDDLLRQMLDHSYQRAQGTLTRVARRCVGDLTK